MENNQKTQGHFSAFITIFIWGTTFISIKVLLESFSPVEILFYRFMLAYLVLLLLSPHLNKFNNIKEELLFIGAGICGITLFFLFQNTALTFTYASNVSVLLSVAPFFTAIFSHFFLKDEKLRVNFFIGFASAILGILLIAYNGNFILKLNPLGDILAVLAAVVWAAYSILMKVISETRTDTLQVTRKVFFYGLIFMIPFLFIFDFQLDLAAFRYPPNLLNMLFLGIGASALCFATWNFAVKVLGPVKTSVYIYVTPVVTIAASAILLDERITAVALLGVVLILAGLFISERA